jgi:hypothetical protein
MCAGRGWAKPRHVLGARAAGTARAQLATSTRGWGRAPTALRSPQPSRTARRQAARSCACLRRCQRAWPRACCCWGTPRPTCAWSVACVGLARCALFEVERVVLARVCVCVCVCELGLVHHLSFLAALGQQTLGPVKCSSPFLPSLPAQTFEKMGRCTDTCLMRGKHSLKPSHCGRCRASWTRLWGSPPLASCTW